MSAPEATDLGAWRERRAAPELEGFDDLYRVLLHGMHTDQAATCQLVLEMPDSPRLRWTLNAALMLIEQNIIDWEWDIPGNPPVERGPNT